ncbi:MAG: hypothetical protein ACXVA6_22290 [Isosphaeraceae bacterium]
MAGTPHASTVSINNANGISGARDRPWRQRKLDLRAAGLWSWKRSVNSNGCDYRLVAETPDPPGLPESDHDHPSRHAADCGDDVYQLETQ